MNHYIFQTDVYDRTVTHYVNKLVIFGNCKCQLEFLFQGCTANYYQLEASINWSQVSSGVKYQLESSIKWSQVSSGVKYQVESSIN
jgi:hypothetical protein